MNKCMSNHRDRFVRDQLKWRKENGEPRLPYILPCVDLSLTSCCCFSSDTVKHELIILKFSAEQLNFLSHFHFI